jgi:hypothetical protein
MICTGPRSQEGDLAEFSERYIEDYCKLKTAHGEKGQHAGFCPLLGQKPLEDIGRDLDQYFKIRKRRISMQP